MNIKKLTFLAFLLPIGSLMSQSPAKHEFRLGLGTSILGTGDMRCITLENEYNYRLNPYFRVGLGIQAGNSENGVFIHSNFRQLGLNLHFSPFKNTGKNDLRIGTGLNFYRVYNVFTSSAMYQNGVLVSETITRGKNQSEGVAINLEYSRVINSTFSWGIKAYSNPYFNGDIQSGILLKGGLSF